jgi:hypothetical protein
LAKSWIAKSFFGLEARCRADLVAAVYDCRGLPVQTPAEEDLSALRLSMTADHQHEWFQLKRDHASIALS